jgi:hypothetical protein
VAPCVFATQSSFLQNEFVSSGDPETVADASVLDPDLPLATKKLCSVDGAGRARA